jgi:GDP/UDP-N,N'-diacetylbacillosamine 2-epimerase (hydrolysing)
MKVGVLTSSRADYGIYLPLLQKLKSDPFFELEIIAFGTHLSKGHGFTLDEIQKDGYNCIRTISSLISNDDEQSIVTSYGLTVLKFADFWNFNRFDLVFCLGDRFEMSAAVQAGIPYGVKFAHIHGGETTLGAIDNVYRHQITLASVLHFTAADAFKKRVVELIGSSKNVFSVGSLSLNDILTFKPIQKQLFLKEFGIKDEDFVLVTFHPETVSPNVNIHFAKEMKNALAAISEKFQVVITMPNADTLGSIYRESLQELKHEKLESVVFIENFGKENYFSAMFYAKALVGNTSSGILEAASFGKYVVNVGDRQKGRLQSGNVIDCGFKEDDIVNALHRAVSGGNYNSENVYYKEGVANSIIKVIKEFI